MNRFYNLEIKKKDNNILEYLFIMFNYSLNELEIKVKTGEELSQLSKIYLKFIYGYHKGILDLTSTNLKLMPYNFEVMLFVSEGSSKRSHYELIIKTKDNIKEMLTFDTCFLETHAAYREILELTEHLAERTELC